MEILKIADGRGRVLTCFERAALESTVDSRGNFDWASANAGHGAFESTDLQVDSAGGCGRVYSLVEGDGALAKGDCWLLLAKKALV